jgi:hypothetical protein
MPVAAIGPGDRFAHVGAGRCGTLVRRLRTLSRNLRPRQDGILRVPCDVQPQQVRSVITQTRAAIVFDMPGCGTN